jgi:hypothetical protein
MDWINPVENSSPIEQHGSAKGKFKHHNVQGGPGSPMEQKIWEKGGIKKQIIDPIVNWNRETDAASDTLRLGAFTAGAFKGMSILGDAVSKTKWAQTPANKTFTGQLLGNIGKSHVGKFVGGLFTKAAPAIGAAAAIGGGYLVGKAAKGILNWASRGVRNVLVTGERTGNEEFKSQWGLTEGGSIDWKGHKGGAGQGELSKKTRKEKGIKVDFK